MIRYVKGDILQAETEAVVNTVNCVGVMGRGIALRFKELFPDNFKAYAAACRRQEIQPGRMFVFETGRMTYPRYIINFPTKRHWRGKSRIEDIEAGLAALIAEIQRRNIRSIAIPPLGCGLGGLDWAEVRPRIEHALTAVPEVEALVFEPGSDRAQTELIRASDPPRLTPGRAALIILIHRYLSALLDPTITLLEVHKLMYFLQVAGESLRLRYVKAPYGPYAENLRHVLKVMEGHWISGYGDGGEEPDKTLHVAPTAFQQASAFLAERQGTLERVDRVTRLVEGYETSFGLELLATVHWVQAQENVTNLPDMIQRVHEWNRRKRQFTPEQISQAAERLYAQGWVHIGVNSGSYE